MDYYFGIAEGDQIILSSEECNHLKNAMRAKTGDTVFVTDGNGNLYTAKFNIDSGHTCTLDIVDVKKEEKKKISLHIAVAPTKNNDRIEWFVEKATESGIDSISFIQCRHSERKEIKTDRLIRVAIAALKQSKKTTLPHLNPIIDFKTFITQTGSGKKLIFTQAAGEDSTLKKNYRAGDDLIALIGPEGDFHADELKLATDLGYIATTLGPSRLRTETAALTVCTLFNFINTQ